MSLSKQDVDHVASLARLGLSDEEKETLRDQLSSILDHIAVLNRLDTDAISPTAHRCGHAASSPPEHPQPHHQEHRDDRHVHHESRPPVVPEEQQVCYDNRRHERGHIEDYRERSVHIRTVPGRSVGPPVDLQA